MTTYKRASVTITRLDITKGLPKGEPTQLYVLQMVSEEMLHVLKDAMVETTLWWQPLWTWVCGNHPMLGNG
jgi:hypothetical protein